MSRGQAPGIPGKSRNHAVAVAAAAGLAAGVASTFPWELGPPTSLTAWTLIGVLIGLLVGRTGRVLTAGISYGVLLTLAFLYSRFGGAAHDLPAYTVFVLAMSIVGGLAGVAIVFVGSRFREHT